MKPIYHLGSPNFGDALPPVLAKHFGYPSNQAHVSSPKIVTVGSLLHMVQSGDTVWGTGSMLPNFKIDKGMNLDVRAVRGPGTRKLLLKGGYTCPEIYGDPAIFLPAMYKAEPERQYTVGFVTHYTDKPLVNKLPLGSTRIWINVMSPLEDIIRQITQCAHIISSSLHGIIAAEAYGIPASWMMLSDRVAGNGFKFRDYALGSGRESAPMLDWRKKVDLEKVDPWPLAVFNRQGLLDCCPYVE